MRIDDERERMTRDEVDCVVDVAGEGGGGQGKGYADDRFLARRITVHKRKYLVHILLWSGRTGLHIPVCHFLHEETKGTLTFALFPHVILSGSLRGKRGREK